MPIYQLGEKHPQLAASAWVADSAQVIGDVRLEADVSIWFNTVLRGDNDPITIGANVDLSTIKISGKGGADNGALLVVKPGAQATRTSRPSSTKRQSGAALSAPKCTMRYAAIS